jgi:hypothetical protein
MNSREKLQNLRMEHEHKLDQVAEGLPWTLRLAWPVARVLAEERIDEFCDQSPAELDDLLARCINRLVQLRSDGTADILGSTEFGAGFVTWGDGDGTVAQWDPVSGPNIRDGGHGIGEVGTGETAVSGDTAVDDDGQAGPEGDS